MKIEFWSDIVCPYCGLMDHRLHLALDRFQHGDDVQVIHRSFQLHPDLPRDGRHPARADRDGGDSRGDRRAGPAAYRGGRRGRRPGPLPRAGPDTGPDRLAHELLAYATDQGRGDEIWTAMFRAHFGQARKLWTVDEVLDFAAEVGLDRDEAAEALRSRRYRGQVAADQREAERLGARGAPFLVFDGRYAVPGAVGIDELLAVMTGRGQDEPPRAAAAGVVGEADGICGPDGAPCPGASTDRPTPIAPGTTDDAPGSRKPAATKAHAP